ncbi:MAG: CRISPR-associated protein Cas4 [Chloroflexi bacterium]|nr:CRISPR-associated protein Cas4 [Chloroflexota bacterium]
MINRPEDYLPISMLNQFEYCTRRFWYMYALGEMDVNAPVLEGTLQHQRAHEPGASHEGETIVQRRVYVWSDRLRLAGFADVIEEADGQRAPIEYKHGRMGRWLNDHIQLCAQALCLEERLTALISDPGPRAGTGQIAHGEIFLGLSLRWAERQECGGYAVRRAGSRATNRF